MTLLIVAGSVARHAQTNIDPGELCIQAVAPSDQCKHDRRRIEDRRLLVQMIVIVGLPPDLGRYLVVEITVRLGGMTERGGLVKAVCGKED